MKWIEITSLDQVNDLIKESEHKPVLIFKHSTRCSTSRMTLDRLERNWDTHNTGIVTYFLDLLSYRQISNHIAENFAIQHESPQVLVISKGRAVLDLSHFDIDYHRICESIKN